MVLATQSVSCRNTPREPSAVSPANSQEQPTHTAQYQPDLEEAKARVVQAWRAWPWDADASVERTAVATEAQWLPLAVTPEVRVLAVKMGPRWTAAAVERDRVTLGLSGAERIFQLRERAQRPMSARELALTAGALAYFPYRTFDGTQWSQTLASVVIPSSIRPNAPMFVAKPQGGRDLTFTFWIPDGSPGAGEHLGRIRVTDSAMLFDESPNPERR